MSKKTWDDAHSERDILPVISEDFIAGWNDALEGTAYSSKQLSSDYCDGYHNCLWAKTMQSLREAE